MTLHVVDRIVHIRRDSQPTPLKFYALVLSMPWPKLPNRDLEESPRIVNYEILKIDYICQFRATSCLKITVEIDIAFHFMGLSPAEDGKGGTHNLMTLLAIHPKIKQIYGIWDHGKVWCFHCNVWPFHGKVWPFHVSITLPSRTSRNENILFYIDPAVI